MFDAEAAHEFLQPQPGPKLRAAGRHAAGAVVEMQPV